MLKKLVTFIISALTMSIMISTAAFAAAPGFTSTSSNMEIKINDQQASIAPRAWPGEGPAKPVTAIEFVGLGYMDSSFGSAHEGNVGIAVKITGYGTKSAKFDKKVIDYFDSEYFINYGTVADGFIYYYDLGLPAIGSHRFDISATSHNAPGNTMSNWLTFDIVPNS